MPSPAITASSGPRPGTDTRVTGGMGRGSIMGGCYRPRPVLPTLARSGGLGTREATVTLG